MGEIREALIKLGIFAGAFVGSIGLTGLMRSCAIVPAGHVAVLDTLGSVKAEELNPGFYWPVNPLSDRVIMETRTQEICMPLNVLTKEGLMTKLDISILYKIDPTKADEIYKNLGFNYTEIVVVPLLRNIVRDVVANYGSEDLYTADRSKIASDISSKLREAYQRRGIVLENVLLMGVTLPTEVTAAIEKKVEAKQAAEQMEYVLQKEIKESERKVVEAKGIADAQQIAKSLTPEYLQWKYISSLENLAKSGNTTFIIAPNYDQKLMPSLHLRVDK